MEIVLFLIGVLVIVLLWFMIYDSNRFVVIEHRIRDVRIRKGIRLVFLSDLHNKQYGKNNEKLLQAIADGKPDIVVIGGDLINGRQKESLQVATDLIDGLKQYPVYYANGNHEHRLELYPEVYQDAGEKYEEELKKRGIKRLINDHVKLEESNVVITGSQIDKLYYRRFTIPEMPEDYMEEILGKPSSESFQVLLAHNPDYFPRYAAWGADLVLSGHIHGGVVRIPFWRGVLSPNIRFFPKYDGGVFREGTSTMILSRGLGMHTIPFRLFNPAELIFVELSPVENPDRA